LINAIYETAAVPERWPDTIERTTEWIGGIAGSFQARRLGHRPAVMLISTGVDPDQHRAYLAYHHKDDPHLRHLKTLPVGRAQLSCDVVDDAELMRTSFYNEFCRPQNFHDLQGIVLLKSKHWAVTLAMFAHRKRRFDARTLSRLSAVAPHITCALSMDCVFDGVDQTEPALRTAAAAHALGLLWVDRSLRIVDLDASSRGADSLHGDELPLMVDRAHLVARHPVDQERLCGAVLRALGDEATVLEVGRGSEKMRLAVAPGPRLSPFSAERCASVLYRRLPQRDTSDLNLRLRDLPPSLHAVATRMANGLSDKEIAVELGLPLSTARTYVTRVLQRLQMNNRRELMRGGCDGLVIHSRGLCGK
jgi:hypothetical protein